MRSKNTRMITTMAAVLASATPGLFAALEPKPYQSRLLDRIESEAEQEVRMSKAELKRKRKAARNLNNRRGV